MRSFNPPEKADIIVSELLGSFGDNELSPECLDGVMRCLKRRLICIRYDFLNTNVSWCTAQGISIPSSYSSYLAPISSSKLHAEVSSSQPPPGAAADGKPAEQPYVVMFSAFHTLSAAGGRLSSDKIQECWGFDHPRPDVLIDSTGERLVCSRHDQKLTFDSPGLPLTNHHNARSAHLTFHIPRAGVCHGFAGYFEAVLYGDVGLSIHPERMAGDMLSWFPIFFPLIVSTPRLSSLPNHCSWATFRNRCTFRPTRSWTCRCGA